ncbi:MAG: hypothetical protein RIB47_08245 [Cyclobacteriaceae bacterium]
MNWSKILRRLIFTSSAIILLLVCLVAPIDRTPLRDQAFYLEMQERLDDFSLDHHEAAAPLRVGWSKFSIIPEEPVPMSGYRIRDKFTDVHDSLYARVLAVDNGSITAYIVSMDLLIFPPELKSLLEERLGGATSFVYFNASHTHTSVGGWDPTLLGNILMGDYQADWMNHVADGIIEHMSLAKEDLKRASLFEWEVDASEHVSHRIDKTGESLVDGKIRGVSVLRSDSSKGLLFSYSVHPTLIGRKKTSLSGDYPAEAVADLSREYEFTQFLAGMMGSHGVMGLKVFEFELTSTIGRSLASKMRGAEAQPLSDTLEIKTGAIEVAMGPSQLRLTKDLKLRDWVFRQVVGPLHGEVRILKIGNILFLGMPCDFSGEVFVEEELSRKADALGLNLIVTSFNGDYTGYITADKHYDTSAHEEVRALNWVGPYFGAYYSEIIERVLEKSVSD